jgi:hypothetical protein
MSSTSPLHCHFHRHCRRCHRLSVSLNKANPSGICLTRKFHYQHERFRQQHEITLVAAEYFLISCQAIRLDAHCPSGCILLSEHSDSTDPRLGQLTATAEMEAELEAKFQDAFDEGLLTTKTTTKDAKQGSWPSWSSTSSP